MSWWFPNFSTPSWPLLLYAAAWTVLLALTVAVASFSPEVAFVTALSPASSFSGKCNTVGFVRVPLDIPTEILCFPAPLFTDSNLDFIVPPLFAAAIVAASACFVKALGFLGNHQIQTP